MDNDRHIHLFGKLQLRNEQFYLRTLVAEFTEIIQTRFTEGDDVRQF